MFYSPLKNAVFRSVWLVMFFSNACTWLHTVTASILITKLTGSAMLIALVQTASVLPIFLLSIPAGVLADFIGRKSLIIFAQALMATIAFVMALITFSGCMTPYLLIGTTFLLNTGLALNQPAWQATSSTLVPASEVKQAAALNNLSFNVSRCIGPAIAGYYFAKLGAGYLFMLNGLSFLIAIVVFSKKIVTGNKSNPVTVRMIYKGCLQTIILYKRFPEIKAIFIKAFLYFFVSSSVWALLPYIVIVYHKMPDSKLGLLTGMVGLGAILNAYGIYYFRKKLTDFQLTTFSLFLSTVVIFTLSLASTFGEMAIVMLVFGYSWSVSVSVFNGTLQADFPVEIRSRLIGLYFVFFAGSQALGGYISGVLTHNFGIFNALTIISILSMVIFFIYFFGEKSFRFFVRSFLNIIKNN